MVGPILNGIASGVDTFIYDKFSGAQLSAITATVGCEAGGEDIAVTGFLSGSLALAIDSRWDTVLGGSGSAIPDNLLNIGDLASQYLQGSSIRQPWFSRGVWRGNGPMKLPLTLQFRAMDDAKSEVWDQIWNLVRLVLPKKRPGTGNGSDLGSQLINGFSSVVGSMSPEIATVLRGILGSYMIPGPSTFHPLNKEFSRTMYCRIGQLSQLSLETCYFTDLKIDIPLVFNPQGYPLYASAAFVVNSQDAMFIDEFGNLQNSFSTSIDNALHTSQVPAQQAKQAQIVSQQANRVVGLRSL